MIFLAAILATVVYLTATHKDVIEQYEATHTPTVIARPGRQRIMLGYFGVVAAATMLLLGWAAAQPHPATSSEQDNTPAPSSAVSLAPGQATRHFPPTEVARLRGITQDTLTKLRAGDQAGATTRVADLETAWDDDQPTLQPQDQTACHYLDARIDTVLKALRAAHPNHATEQQALTTLLDCLTGK